MGVTTSFMCLARALRLASLSLFIFSAMASMCAARLASSSADASAFNFTMSANEGGRGTPSPFAGAAPQTLPPAGLAGAEGEPGGETTAGVGGSATSPFRPPSPSSGPALEPESEYWSLKPKSGVLAHRCSIFGLPLRGILGASSSDPPSISWNSPQSSPPVSGDEVLPAGRLASPAPREGHEGSLCGRNPEGLWSCGISVMTTIVLLTFSTARLSITCRCIAC
mmetsp:Transcript_10847/g.32106  ORF Transcript_10847/g.32106 Transcript_10847/m.32106 type:complete len:224 (-) Transcript_10847:164-835(-)